jgi:YHS domain-containing protein
MKRSSVLTAMLIILITSCCHKSAEISSRSSKAIDGYDPVSYFKEGGPVKGNKEFTYKWKGADWLFSSKQNLDTFAGNPEKFAPQYGGWCAYACSYGRKAPGDPNAWKIVDGKLYLNKSLEIREKWIEDQGQRIVEADKNWPSVKDK